MIPLTSGNITQILNYIGEIVGDFLPLIVVILGIGIGLWVVERLIFRR